VYQIRGQYAIKPERILHGFDQFGGSVQLAAPKLMKIQETPTLDFDESPGDSGLYRAGEWSRGRISRGQALRRGGALAPL